MRDAEKGWVAASKSYDVMTEKDGVHIRIFSKILGARELEQESLKALGTHLKEDLEDIVIHTKEIKTVSPVSKGSSCYFHIEYKKHWNPNFSEYGYIARQSKIALQQVFNAANINAAR